MGDWPAFVGILVVQGLGLASVQWIQQKGPTLRLLLAALGSGIVLGLLFDLLIGDRFDVFSYHLRSTLFYLLNGALSYGLAIATALVVSPPPIHIDSDKRRHAIMLTAGGMIFAVILFLSGVLPPIWAIGAIVIAVGEFVEAAYFGTAGPFLDVWYGRITRALQYWLKSIAIGSLYEIANAYFPVWIWSFNRPVFSFYDQVIIIVFGYVVLLHASRIFGLLALDFVARLSPSKS